ncbi:dihydrodipicolinate synthase family protein [Jidongwangia harbinensis]|uniref:dihydrodipicolinate synthase family protein n=1 Tax=Jidongwangia harbinensis TaxID=2878561 RepID=UPI001CD942CA|nr:dihydrodipicolinate synthase family protein [Jidongwangia harbinensis]MCA2214917.1 dihydrodipicolinate synthase family protein [Jidongwangia harbinensis]
MTLTGLYVPMITPFDAAGAVAADVLTALAHDVLDAGATGLVALGTTAEPGSLTGPERDTVVDVLAGVCRSRSAGLLVGADTVAAVRALRTRPEVTAALSLVPPFVRPGADGVVAHLTELAGTGVPIVVYHVPYRTGQSLPEAALRRLAGVPGVAGVKYATGAVDPTAVALLADPPAGHTAPGGDTAPDGTAPGGTAPDDTAGPGGFAVLGGDDAVVAPLLALGAHGGILASAHVATAAFAELIAAWRAGDAARARPLGRRLAGLSAALFAEPNPTVVKGVLHARGRIPTPAVRLPLLPAARDSVTAALRHAESLENAG